MSDVDGREVVKVWEVRNRFGLDFLELAERSIDPPGAGEVRVALRAASLNYRDLMMIRGQYDPRIPLPFVPASDGVGEVTEIGAGVSRVHVGDRVACIFSPTWISGDPEREYIRQGLGGRRDGTLARAINVPAEGLVHVPEHLSDVEAASLPCAAVTAWTALTRLASLTAGDILLVQGTGGVSIFALQFARLLGARVIATSSSDDKRKRLSELGAWATINYRVDPVWGKTALELTGGRGVDQVIEVGGAQTLSQSLKAIRPGGTISLIGVLSGSSGELGLTQILMRQIRVQGVVVGNRTDFENMNRAIAAHELRPLVDRVFPFEEVPKALDYLKSGAHFGKVCIRIA